MISENTLDFRSLCPIASTLDLIGDRWSILILRDLMLGASKYNDFLCAPEKIPTNILAQRLKFLEQHGIISKKPYQTKPLRYEYSLTHIGEGLKIVLRTLREWGMLNIENRNPDPPAYMKILAMKKGSNNGNDS